MASGVSMSSKTGFGQVARVVGTEFNAGARNVANAPVAAAALAATGPVAVAAVAEAAVARRPLTNGP